MILKLQQSIPDGDRCLLYNEDSSVLDEFEMLDNIAALMGDRTKIFVEAEIDDEGILHIDSEVDDPGW